MSNNLQIISDALRSQQTLKRVALALGETDAQQTESKRYAASVLAELEKMAMDSKKKEILNCSPHSIAQTMIDAAKFRLMIDGRQHAHIVQYGASATLQIGYRAYLFKIKEAYPDADITVRPIYQGEAVHIKDENGFQSYTVESELDPFDAKADMLKGVMVAVTYTDGGRLVSKAMPILKDRIDRARSSAKQDFIWKSDYIEKAKAAAIKSAFKIMFTQIQAVQEMIDFDNKTNFQLGRPQIEAKAGSIIENLNSVLVDAPKQVEQQQPEVIDGGADHSDVLDYVPAEDLNQ